MTRDVSESIDEYCESQYGHTNWAYLSTLSKQERREFNDKDLGVIEGGIVFYWKKYLAVISVGLKKIMLTKISLPTMGSYIVPIVLRKEVIENFYI